MYYNSIKTFPQHSFFVHDARMAAAANNASFSINRLTKPVASFKFGYNYNVE